MASREEQLIQRLRDAAIALQRTTAERDELARQQAEPIAIVGMACRFPGGANSPEEYWRFLLEERDAIVPLERRWKLAREAPPPGVPGWAGLIDEVAGFDAAFFGISPREAASLDPQHRLLLEVTWEALENGGLVPAALSGGRTGVFVGAGGTDYLHLVDRQPDAAQDAYGTTGNLLSILAGRLSYTLGFQGPCLIVDTACSSSLVAVHLGCHSLRSRESDVVIAAGVSLILSPAMMSRLSRTQALSPDGRCRTFDAGANGYVRGEGCGVVVLKRLSDARQAGNRIWALIRGSAVNQDGRSNGLTAPNVRSQEALLRDALAAARLSPEAVGYVETHGTGTSLGDPIEAEALRAVLGAPRQDGSRCVLGAVKTNIGHLEAAAGIAGLIKGVLALHHEQIPRNLNFRTLNPRIRLAGTALSLATETTPWPRSTVPRRGGVSSFGMSGTNAHVLLEEAPASDPLVAASSLPLGICTLSAKTAEALNLAASRLIAHLDAHPNISLANLAYSLATGRSKMEHRLALAVDSADSLRAALETAARGITPIMAARGTAQGGLGKLVWMFTGQGAQRVGMGRTLYGVWPVFREALDEAIAVLNPHLGRPLREVMWAEADHDAAALLDQTGYTQPALFALEWALAALWRSWGVQPDLVLGHSVGEITAACVAGVFSLPEAARLVAARAGLMQGLRTDGAMLSVHAAESQIRAHVLSQPQRLSIAAVNEPQQVVLSGDVDAILEIAQRLELQGIKVRRLSVSHAFHSGHMDAMLEAFGKVAQGLRYQAPRIPLISTVTGQRADPQELCSGPYWVQQVRRTVRFADSVRAARSEGVTRYLECGPQGVLTALAATCLEQDPSPEFIPSLRKGVDENAALMEAVCRLHVGGQELNWQALFAGVGARQIELPTYPFERQRHWVEAPRTLSLGASATGIERVEHPLLRNVSSLPDGSSVFWGRLSLREQPWLSDHQVFGQTILPGTALVELLLAAGAKVGTPRILSVSLDAPVRLGAGEDLEVQVWVQPADGQGQRAARVHTRLAGEAHDGGWTRHSTGVLAAREGAGSVTMPTWPPAGASPLPLEDLYARLANQGLSYGPAFQGLKEAYQRGDTLYARVMLPPEAREEASGYRLHPALFDAALHSLGAGAGAEAGVQIPYSLEQVTFRGVVGQELPEIRVELRALTEPSSEQRQLSLMIYDAAGALVARVGMFCTRAVSEQKFRAAQQAHGEHLYRLKWSALDAPQDPQPPGAWGLWGTGELADRVADALRNQGFLLHRFASLTAMPEGIDAEPRPLVGVVRVMESEHEQAPDAGARAATAQVLRELQEWMQSLPLGAARLVLLTQQAVLADSDAADPDLIQAPLWGLFRTARTEYPDHALCLLDLDGTEASLHGLGSALRATDAPEAALRQGVRLVPSLMRIPLSDPDTLPIPEDAHWHLHSRQRGLLDALELRPTKELAAPLERGQVQISVRYAGLNFRDVLNALNMYPGEAGWLGLEGCGEVSALGGGVEGLKPGDRVMGLWPAAFGPVARTDARQVVPIPSGMTDEEAATIPVAFLTALYGLCDLGQLRAGEKVLIHAAAGGVGLAALQIARSVGAEVFATAHPAKWSVLRAMGVREDHIASSRTLDFQEAFLRVTQGTGVDLILNSLSQHFVDASLGLLPRGGRFVEMGKTDLRDADAVAHAHPGVRYRAFDVMEAGPERIQQMLQEVVARYEQGELTPLPYRSVDLRQASAAFRQMAAGQHRGKIVLRLPRALASAGTVLITGGTRGLGGEVARHLATQHGVRHLLLLSRQGTAAPEVAQLVETLARAGCTARVADCDVGDRQALSAVLQSIPIEHPLTAVVHCAGRVWDGMLATLTDEHIDAVLRAKVEGAWNLHLLTRHLPLSAFVLFSSASGLLGAAGQANYAAGNTFLDALAGYRQARGLPATSIAWGSWGEVGLAARLPEVQRQRLQQQGVIPLSTEEGLGLFDRALGHPEALVCAAHLELAAKPSAADLGFRSPLLHALISDPGPSDPRSPGRQSEGGQLDPLWALGPQEQERVALEWVRTEVAAVLRLQNPQQIQPERPLRELGIDSLLAIEIKNRLSAVFKQLLPATLVFDYPTPQALVQRLLAGLTGPEKKIAADSPARPVVPAGRDDDPIALVSLACRVPGNIHTPEQLWGLLREGKDAISGFPKERGWDEDSLYDPDPATPGKSVTNQGGFLRDIDQFDAAFFGISPREAISLDPQQRLLLELSWEALERAGIPPLSLNKSRTGVFIGAYRSGYDDRLNQHLEQLDGYVGTGNAMSTASGRISYTLGLQGPALTVDTACSSSLVSIHLACQSLRAGECDLAIAGGVTLMSTPTLFVEFSRLGGLAPDGRCKAFSDGADGVGWSEGGGLVVLERLRAAERNGHRVLAIIAGSAVNQDGRSQGLTAPNGPAQQRVILDALQSAGVKAEEVDAVECHGTGTTLGDPIEAQALLSTYGMAHTAERPLWIGSLKSNLGHMQAAAGVGGVIKMVLALQHGELPQTLHALTPSRHIAWSGGQIQLLQQAQKWERTVHPRRAGVSSFGISGTNAHVILEEAPQKPAADEAAKVAAPSPAGSQALPLLLSGQNEAALRASAALLAGYLEAHSPQSLSAVAFTLATARSHLATRAALVLPETADAGQAAAALRAIGAGKAPAGWLSPAAKQDGQVVVLFTGQGSQRVGMGKELYRSFEVFRKTLDELCALLDPLLPRALKGVMFAEAGSEEARLLDETQYAQPALFVFEVALFRQWEHFGLRADLLLGHSLGELSAAHAAGFLSQEDACKLVATRGRLMQEAVRGGAMFSVAASESEGAALLAEKGGLLSLAAINGPNQITISGDREAAEQLARQIEGQGRRVKQLNVSHAFHSPHMDGILNAFGEAAQGLKLREPRVGVISCVSGKTLVVEDLREPEYWRNQVRGAVRYADGVRRAAQLGGRIYLECGPHRVLAGMAAEVFGGELDAVFAASQRSGVGEGMAFVEALGRMYSVGIELNWRAVLGDGRVLANLPTYPFQRQRYWLESTATPPQRAEHLGMESPGHPLLGSMTPLPDGGYLFATQLAPTEHPWLRDHAIFGSGLLPGTAYVELALAAGQCVGTSEIESLTLERPLLLGQGGAQRLQLSVSPEHGNGQRSFQIHSCAVDVGREVAWIQHATGLLRTADPLAARPGSLLAWPPQGADAIDLSDLYQRLQQRGYHYGSSFRGLRRAYRQQHALYGEVELPAAVESTGYQLHPALLDTVLHLLLAGTWEEGNQVVLPFEWEGVRLHVVGARKLRVQALLSQAGTGPWDVRLHVYGTDGQQVGEVERLSTRPTTEEMIRMEVWGRERHLYRMQWGVRAIAERKTISGVWAVLGSAEQSRALAQQLSKSGEHVVHLPAMQDLATAVAGGMAAPEHILAVAWATGPGPAAGDAAAVGLRATQDLQRSLQILSETEPLANCRFVLVTESAVATQEGEAVDGWWQAGLWGLLRTARSEHPERAWRIVDLDGSTESRAQWIPVLSMPAEDEVALRQGVCRVPRLVQAGPAARPDPARGTFDSQRTVLVTGGTQGVGALVALHLARQHQVRQLLLVSRQGANAPGVASLVAELAALGCATTVTPCDVSDYAALTQCLGQLSSAHPLQAVFHCAGVLDDGVLSTLTAERTERVFMAKAQGAWNLHQATRQMSLSAFVVFSSAAGLLGSAAQANYAAANTWVDALCAYRQALRLPAQSLAWGTWAGSGMAAQLSESAKGRLRQQGIVPLRPAQALDLLDQALSRSEPLLVPIQLDLRSLRKKDADNPATLLQSLLGPRAKATASGADGAQGRWLERLQSLAVEERERGVLECVQQEIVAVMRLAEAAALPPDQPLKELGLDSLLAMEIRNRLRAGTGLRLPSSLVFDRPTPLALAQYLCTQLFANQKAPPVPVLAELDKLESLLSASDVQDSLRAGITSRLQALLSKWTRGQSKEEDAVIADKIQAATPDEIFSFIDQELGIGQGGKRP